MSRRKASAIVASLALAVIALVAGLYYATFGIVRAHRVAATDFVLPNVTIITPRIERLSDQDVGIAGGKIERVGPAASVLSPTSLEEFRGMYVLPGLFDMHTHFPPGNMLHLTEHALLLFLAHGVTGVRALGD
jgi:cytosine/adenosine deaminase-related metal-dependent hydrolase